MICREIGDGANKQVKACENARGRIERQKEGLVGVVYSSGGEAIAAGQY